VVVIIAKILVGGGVLTTKYRSFGVGVITSIPVGAMIFIGAVLRECGNAFKGL
jgi:hypothetical protein